MLALLLACTTEDPSIDTYCIKKAQDLIPYNLIIVNGTMQPSSWADGTPIDENIKFKNNDGYLIPITESQLHYSKRVIEAENFVRGTNEFIVDLASVKPTGDIFMYEIRNCSFLRLLDPIELNKSINSNQ